VLGLHERIIVKIGQHQCGSGPCELFGDGAADPPRGAGDQDDSFYVCHDIVSPVIVVESVTVGSASFASVDATLQIHHR
jgi:hypothetical protein